MTLPKFKYRCWIVRNDTMPVWNKSLIFCSLKCCADMALRPKPDRMRIVRECATGSARAERVTNRPPQPSRRRGGGTGLRASTSWHLDGSRVVDPTQHQHQPHYEEYQQAQDQPIYEEPQQYHFDAYQQHQYEAYHQQDSQYQPNIEKEHPHME